DGIAQVEQVDGVDGITEPVERPAMQPEIAAAEAGLLDGVEAEAMAKPLPRPDMLGHAIDRGQIDGVAALDDRHDEGQRLAVGLRLIELAVEPEVFDAREAPRYTARETYAGEVGLDARVSGHLHCAPKLCVQVDH